MAVVQYLKENGIKVSTGTVTDCRDRSGSVVVTWRAAMKERDHERKAGDAAVAALPPRISLRAGFAIANFLDVP